VNKQADNSKETVRISFDAKVDVKMGDFGSLIFKVAKDR